MSKSRPKRHLAPVPTDAPKAPASRPWFETVELPTGNRKNIGGLLYELCAVAFPGVLAGYEFSFDLRVGWRFHVTVQLSDAFPPERLAAGQQAVSRALLVLGVLKPAKAAEAAPTDEKTLEDGAQSPPQAPQLPPT